MKIRNVRSSRVIDIATLTVCLLGSTGVVANAAENGGTHYDNACIDFQQSWNIHRETELGNWRKQIRDGKSKEVATTYLLIAATP